MKIAIEGCAHGELENIYDTIELLQEKEKIKVDLLICCGDFQSSRNEDDLTCMAVPEKYRHICTFYKYYSGEKIAPILTIFIGGNHEASNYLQELPYGGWVAQNIYYMGYAGVINIGGFRIGGLSGIYKGNDFFKGHYEKPPYDEQSKRTVYHVRNLEVFRLKQLSGKLDIFISHDWPTNITKFGNVKQLLKRKPFFKEDIENNKLGSQPCEQLLQHLKPTYWFSAHLHCRFAALVEHEDGGITKFLALDKCLPRRKFLQVIDLTDDSNDNIKLHYDLEWLTILYLTNHLLSVKNNSVYMPGPGVSERYNFTPTKEEKDRVLERIDNNLKIPRNFVRTAPAYTKEGSKKSKKPIPVQNPQTVHFCDILAIDDPLQLISENTGIPLSLSMEESFSNTTFIEDTLENEGNTSKQSPSRKLGNLSLPEPKMESKLLQTTEENDDSNLVSEDKCVEKEMTTELELHGASSAEENNDKEEKIEERPSDSPLPKKLKRRNVDLYKS